MIIRWCVAAPSSSSEVARCKVRRLQGRARLSKTSRRDDSLSWPTITLLQLLELFDTVATTLLSAWQSLRSGTGFSRGLTGCFHLLLQIVIECFDHICPKTVANFVELVKGKHEAGRYEGTRMNRVVKKGWLQGGNIAPVEEGDVVKSTYGGAFADETFNVKHDKMVKSPTFTLPACSQV